MAKDQFLLVKIIGYCYHSVDMIKKCPVQSDHIKRLTMYNDFKLSKLYLFYSIAF